jgi:hypothetical protein
MADSNEAPGAGASAPAVKKRRKWKWILAAVLLTPIVLFVLYTYAALHYTYSRGERAGYLQKFSQKGWICKTWEGEIAMANLPGAMPEVFSFTVRDDSIASILNNLSGQRVALHYAQRKGLPTSCFGDTEYFVEGVSRIQAP